MMAMASVPLRSRWRRTWAAAIDNSRVPAACRPQQEALVRARVAAFSRVLAVLTLAWIPIDAAGLGMAHAGATSVLRAAIALGLLALAHFARRVPAQTLLHAFFWLQAIGFGNLQMLVESARTDAAQIGYGLFPFLLAAQLGLFAVPWWRALLMALAPAAQFAATQLLPWDPQLLPWSGLWLLVLIIAVATWSSHAQLRLLIRLLDARRDAVHDELTGLPNRRAAALRLEAERSRALRQREPLSLLMLDLDHFKRVNDRWGHDAGDRVLAAVAQFLREELRGIDMPARHGGEEFMAILPNTNPAQALQVAERVRERIARTAIELSRATTTITTSVGIATLVPGETAGALVARADAALYAAKEDGRNRCVTAPG
jgi:diguanylate cyclase (GGDEF)-like protein